MKTILITGGNGYIAQSIYRELKGEYTIRLLTRQEVDITDSHAVNAWFSDKHFDVVIHTAISGGSRLKEENYAVIDNNLRMYYNLLNNRDKFDRFINIGSGAELLQRDTPYGLSKHIIQKSIHGHENFYNIRVFAVFDENELNTRFIKGNIIKYLNKEPMLIHNNKRMDFFYMLDFVNVVRYYIESNELSKEFDCSYEQSCYLSDIAKIINSLGNHTVPVNIIDQETIVPNYSGRYQSVGLEYIGLHNGIISVYDKLCKI